MEEIHKMRQRSRRLIVSMAILLLLVMLGSIHFGRFSISLSELWRMIRTALTQGTVVTQSQAESVLWKIRIPRLIGNIFVGSGLALSGATFQALFENPMASSDILGVSQGAAFGAVLAMLFLMPSQTVILSAFVMGIVSVGITYFISSSFRMERTLGLILAGMVVGSLFQSGVSFSKMVADPENVLPAITYWLLGSFSAVKWEHLRIVAIPIAIGVGIILTHRQQLNLLTLGEQKAQTVGVNLKRVRAMLIIGATLITASCVAITGLIGWIGLIIPHICRFLVGSDYRYVIPCSLFVGAAFTMVVDTFARTLASIEIPIGILTAIVGAPIFVALLIKGRGRSHASG